MDQDLSAAIHTYLDNPSSENKIALLFVARRLGVESTIAKIIKQVQRR